MTPKELRNLKRLIKSGDEDNIRLALSLATPALKKWIKNLEAIREYCNERWSLKMKRKYKDFWEFAEDKCLEILDFVKQYCFDEYFKS